MTGGEGGGVMRRERKRGVGSRERVEGREGGEVWDREKREKTDEFKVKEGGG